MADTNIVVTSVHPGGIDTNIVRNARINATPGSAGSKEKLANSFQNIARTSAEDAAKTIIKGIKSKTKRLLIGADAHLIDILKRLAPETFTGMVGYMARKIG